MISFYALSIDPYTLAQELIDSGFAEAYSLTVSKEYCCFGMVHCLAAEVDVAQTLCDEFTGVVSTFGYSINPVR